MEYILPPKQKRRPLPFLLSSSFFYSVMLLYVEQGGKGYPGSSPPRDREKSRVFAADLTAPHVVQKFAQTFFPGFFEGQQRQPCRDLGTHYTV